MPTRTSLDKPSLWIAIIASILIFILVTLGVLGKFFLDEFTSRVLLISLILVISIIGIFALTFLEVRKKVVRKKEAKLIEKNGFYYQNVQPSAPTEEKKGNGVLI
ncbi:hypothetical protein ABEB36_002653 [Hypothenemus hampei]|uniref:Uncharacterized protein n=1 Tax=Hypothenemus hampei TaxID=57062 RepID=A0ABD1F9N2_HYPHA